MPRKPRAVVFDSWAIVAYFEGEPSGEKVETLMVEAHENGIPLLMSVVNAGEVWYIIAREVSAEVADLKISELRELGIEFVDADWKLTYEAARFKSRYRMAYADCFVAALAKENRADLVTGDPEFKQVEGEVRIHWL